MFKPQDKAVITVSPLHDNLGRVIDLVRVAGHDHMGVVWLTASNVPFYGINYTVTPPQLVRSNQIHIQQWMLRPFLPDEKTYTHSDGSTKAVEELWASTR